MPQHPAESTAARGLPRLWVTFLEATMDCDREMLDRSLPRDPDRYHFAPGKRWDLLPLKNLPPVVSKVFDTGHWPDNFGYKCENLDGRFNLLRRTERHVRGSRDWIFLNLHRAALGLPHNPEQIDEALTQDLARFGVRRLDPLVSLLLTELLDSELQPLLFAPTWRAIASHAHPLNVEIMTLLVQQQRVEPRLGALASALEQECLRAWTRFVRHPIVSRDRSMQREAIGTARAIWINVHTLRSIGASPSTGMNALCPLWRPTPAMAAAEVLLRSFGRRVTMELAEIFAKGPLFPRPPPSPLGVADREAVAVVLEGIVAARSGWESCALPELLPDQVALKTGRNREIPADAAPRRPQSRARLESGPATTPGVTP